MINKSKIIKDAQKFVAKAQWDKAISEYEKILADTPGDANTHNTVGDLYLKKNDPNKAILSYKSAAEIFNRSGFTLKAIALYKKVLNIKPDQIDIMLIMGKMNAERGLLGNANESYLAAAAYFSRHNQTARAIDVYKTLCDLNPENLALAQKLAELYLSEGFETEGVSKFIELAESKLVQGDLALAHDLLLKASQKGSDRFEFIRVSASLDLKSNRMTEAVNKLEELIKLNPGDVRVISLLAEAHLGSGQYEKSAELYRALLELEPGNIPYRVQLHDAYLKSGDYDYAWKECKTLVEAHIARSEFEEAQRLLREFLGHKPDSIEARQQLADIYSKTGHEEETIKLHAEMADLYHASGETEKAVNIYSELLAKNPDDEAVKAKLSKVSEPAPTPPPDIPDIMPDIEPVTVPDIAATEPSPAPPWLEESPEPVMEAAAGTEPSEEISAAHKIFELVETGPGDADLPAEDASSAGTEFEPIEPEKNDADFMVEDVPSGHKTYELPSEPAAFDLDEEEEYLPETDEKVVELPEVGHDELADLDIFGTETEEEQQPEETPAAPVASEENLADMLAEIDVYIGYGLIDKAMTALSELEGLAPANPELLKRRIEVCKSLGDVDRFVDASVELARMYVGTGLTVEAEKVIRKAQEIDPYDERLVTLLTELSPAEPSPTEMPEVALEGPAEPSPAETPEVALEGPAEPSLAETPEIAFEGQEEPSEVYNADTHADEVLAQTEQAAKLSPGSIIYLEELAEADFYAQQGLTEEAGLIYRRLIEVNPDDPGLRSRYEALAEKPTEEPQISDTALMPFVAPSDEGLVEENEAEEAVPAMPSAAPSDIDEAFETQLDSQLDAAFGELDLEEELKLEEETTAEPDGDFFDLAAELKDELDEDGPLAPVPSESSFQDKHLEEVFLEFKKGVEEQLGKEDYETHYNLGIAYKEMGMISEALGEFVLAAKDPARGLDCASMRGLCYLEKGDYDEAIREFNAGLDIKGREKVEYMGLKYDLATAYELKGDIAAAQGVVNGLVREDDGFRDVKDRLMRLNKTLMEAGIQPPGPNQPDAPPTPPKKSKVSYL